MEVRNIDQLRDLSSLSRAVFKADVPESAVRELPAQTLYQIICYNGMESSVDLIEMASIEQTRILLDFDLWSPDGFDEEHLWNWLELSSEEDDLVILQKVVAALDLKIVALLINKHLEIVQKEESTDSPPGPLFFTPDNGYTWIRVICEEERKHFLISKLLAFLFESNSDIFYQLLATKTITTPAVLEEEALADKTKRLSAEGLPDQALAAEITSFLSVAEGLKQTQEACSKFSATEIIIAEALTRLSDSIEPLTSALKEVENLEDALSEMTLLINSVLVRFRAILSDNQGLLFFASQTHGALNLGLDLLILRSGLSAENILNKVGLQIPFRVGLTQILDISKTAKKYEKTLVDSNLEIDQTTRALLDLLNQGFPCLPGALSQHKRDYAISDSENLSVRPEPFRYFSEIELLRSRLTLKPNSEAIS